MQWLLVVVSLTAMCLAQGAVGQNPSYLTRNYTNLIQPVFLSIQNTLTLGVCNGCQMISNLAESIQVQKTGRILYRSSKSERFEARVSLVKINKVDSVWFAGMAAGSYTRTVSHEEGQVKFKSVEQFAGLKAQGIIAAQYIDNNSKPTELYHHQSEWFFRRHYLQYKS